MVHHIVFYPAEPSCCDLKCVLLLIEYGPWSWYSQHQHCPIRVSGQGEGDMGFVKGVE